MVEELLREDFFCNSTTTSTRQTEETPRVGARFDDNLVERHTLHSGDELGANANVGRLVALLARRPQHRRVALETELLERYRLDERLLLLGKTERERRKLAYWA